MSAEQDFALEAYLTARDVFSNNFRIAHGQCALDDQGRPMDASISEIVEDVPALITLTFGASEDVYNAILQAHQTVYKDV